MATTQSSLRRFSLGAIHSTDKPPYERVNLWQLQTPVDTPETVASRRLFIPDNRSWKVAVNGILSLLSDANYWRENIIAGITPEQAASAANTMFEDYLHSEGWMIGTIVPYITTETPQYTLACNGATYNRVDYPELYARLGSPFVVDSDTFTVPDLRQKVVVGAAVASGYTVGAIGGESEHTLSELEIPSHSHIDAGHGHLYTNAIPSVTIDALGVPLPSAVPGVSTTATGFASIQPTGGGQAHNNMQPYVALNYAVYYK